MATLSVADQSYVHRLDEEVDDLCIFCRTCTSSVPHILWHCCHPKLVAAKASFSDNVKLASIERTLIENADLLPIFLQHGIPPPLALLPNTPWWTNSAVPQIAQESRQIQIVFGIDQSFDLSF